MAKKNYIYTKEKWDNCNKQNKDLINDYILELTSQNKSERTIEQYFFDLRMILCYIHDELDNVCVLDIKKNQWRSIVLWLLNERKVSPARCNRIISSIKNLLNYAEEDDSYDYDINITRRIKTIPKKTVKEIFFLTDEEIEVMRNYLLENKKYKLCCYLDFMYDSGARRNEIFQIRKDIDINSSFTNKVILKGGNSARLVFHKRTKESLKLYIEQRGKDDFESLWISEKTIRKEAQYTTLYDWCKALNKVYFKLFNKKLNFNPHSFRHTALENYQNGTHYMCKELGVGGFSIEDIQVLAHHKSSDITRSYLKNKDIDTLEKMFKLTS